MGLLNQFKLRKRKEPPPQQEWPDYVIPLDKENFQWFIDKYPLSIVDFWAPWCAPCKKISPRIKQLSKIYMGKVAFGKINVGTNREIANQYQIMNIPRLIFFSYGKKIASLAGVQSISDIKRKIKSILKRI